MNYYKPAHPLSPQQIHNRSNQMFLKIIALYLLLVACGFGIDIKFYHQTDDRIYYLVEDKKELDDRITADLNYYGQQKQYPPLTNSDICRFLKLEVIRDAQDELTIRIWDSNKTRFEIPEKDNEVRRRRRLSSRQTFTDLDVQLADEDNRFRLKIARKGSKQQTNIAQTSVLNFTDREFVFSDKVIEWGTTLDSEYIWGLGQRNTESFMLKKSGNYTIWNKSQPPGLLDEGLPDHQANGFHPMYLRKEASDRNWHVVLIRTSSGIGFEYNKTKHSIQFRMLGGIFTLKLFLGDSPSKVIEAYHTYLGGYLIPPFWAMGFHQSRRGYNNSSTLIDVWNNFNQNQLPVDAIWSDVDYMINFEAFTIDSVRFNTSAMNSGMLNLSNMGVRWVPTVPFGIHTEQAIAKNYSKLVVESGNYPENALVGCGLPVTVYFPDYNNPSTALQLTYSLKGMLNNVSFEGVWLVGTEIYNQVSGQGISTKEVKCGIIPETGTNRQDGNYSNFSTLISKVELNHRSLNLNAKYYGGQDATIVKAPANGYNVEYDFHNLNSLAATKAAYESFKRLDIRRPLVMSTTTFFGMGKYAGHIVQDSYSSFDWLALSLPAIFNFQLFGIPFTGVDICGKEGNATAELCARWMALGSMYPFSRNYNSLSSSPQQPYAFSQPYVLQASLNSLRLRYSLLKYYYSVFANSYGVGTVFSPLFVEFPDDPGCLEVQTQAMIGPALLVTPVLSQSKIGTSTAISPYFPEGNWFSITDPNLRFRGRQTISFNVSFNQSCPTFIREGYVVIYQDTQLEDGTNITRTYQLNNHFTLLIALGQSDNELSAKGFLVSISDYSQYMDRCVETEEDCVIDVLCTAKFVPGSSSLQLSVKFDVQQIDTFTNFFVDGVKVYLQNFKTNHQMFDEPIKINSGSYSFQQILMLEQFDNEIYQ